MKQEIKPPRQRYLYPRFIDKTRRLREDKWLAQGHRHQARGVWSLILNPGQSDTQVCSGSVDSQWALKKQCCGPQRVDMWPQGAQRPSINAQSIPGSASAPGAVVSVQGKSGLGWAGVWAGNASCEKFYSATGLQAPDSSPTGVGLESPQALAGWSSDPCHHWWPS